MGISERNIDRANPISAGSFRGRAFKKPQLDARFSKLTLAVYRGRRSHGYSLAAAFRLFVFAARLRADFSFRFRTAFFAADILTVRMSILSGRSYAPFTAIRLGYF